MGFLSFLWPFKKYTFHSSGKEGHFESTPKQWAMATNSILSFYNGTNIDVLGGMLKTPGVIKGIKYNLKDNWDITDRESLLNTLNWLKDNGHRGETTLDETGKTVPGFMSLFNEYKKNVDSLNKQIDELDEDEEQDQIDELNFYIESVTKYASNIEKNDFLAWDLVRYINLLGMGYIAEYITEEEAYNFMYPIAKQLQSQFKSWRELGENYLLGRGYWNFDKTENEIMYEDLEKLLKDPASPWIQIDFYGVKF